jgi:hypothetical protein
VSAAGAWARGGDPALSGPFPQPAKTTAVDAQVPAKSRIALGETIITSLLVEVLTFADSIH